MWSYIPDENANSVMKHINDYKYIYLVDGKKLTVPHINELFKTNLLFITQQLEKAKAGGYKPIVITHHAPAIKGTSLSVHESSRSNCAFASDILASDLPLAPKLWIHGHTHYNSQHKPHRNGYELVSNQYGYEGEHEGLTYKFSCVFDIN